MHWQNAFVGEERQVVAVTYDNEGTSSQFWIDNQDGSGLRKIERGGGPDSYSAHVGEFEFIRELHESEWQQWDPELHKIEREKGDEWQKKNFPKEHEQMLKLRKMIESKNFHLDRNGTIKEGRRR